MTPELNVARTKVLDYLASRAHLDKVFNWENTEVLDCATGRFLRLMCVEAAFPKDEDTVRSFLAVRVRATSSRTRAPLSCHSAGPSPSERLLA